MNHRDLEIRSPEFWVTEKILGACIAVHRSLGPGLLESAYEECLCWELSQREIAFERQVPLPVRYGDVALDCGYRLDLVIEGSVVLELKAVEQFAPLHLAQVLTYLKLGGYQTGLLINFNVTSLRQGIKRVSQQKTS